MKTFAIGIPTLNRYDLLKEALEQYVVDFPNTKIFIIDNGKQDIKDIHLNIHLYNSEYNLGVASSWNELCKLIFEEHSHALILNDDIQFRSSEEKINNLIETVESDFYVGPYYWSAFIIPKTTVEKIGGFDETFWPAYYEDNDYYIRLKIGHCTYTSTDVLLPTVCRNSMTLQKDPTVNKSFENVKQFYVSKWGGEPGQEKFITPFNNNIEW